MSLQDCDYSSRLTREFKNSLGSDATRESYCYAITGFMQYLGIENKNDYSELLVNGQQPKLIQSEIIDYIMYLRNNKNASSSKINIAFHAIKHYYKTTVELEGINWDKIARFKGENKTTIEKRPYTKEEIYKLINVAADLRDKAMILLAASSGLRRDAIRSLRIGDLRLIEKYNLYQLTVYPKTEQQYITFCTPEATKAIDQYLEWRKRMGENFNNGSPLFRKQFNNRDPIKVRAPAQFLGLKSMDFIINKLLNKAGIRLSQKLAEDQKIPAKTEIAEWHSFRYFYDTTLTFAGVGSVISEMLMGHDIGLKRRYFKPTDIQKLEGKGEERGYIAAVPALTIQATKEENEKLRQQILELGQHDDELKVLRSKYEQDMRVVREEMEKKFSKIMSVIQLNPQLARIKPEVLSKKVNTSE